jgi:hypothetical protein
MWMFGLAIACQGDGDPDGNLDDTGTAIDDSATGDDSATNVDDSGTDDSATGGDDSATDDSATGGDDSGTPGTFEVVLSPNPNMVTAVTAEITLSTAHPVKLVCEAPTKNPWPERIVVRDGGAEKKHTLYVDGLLSATTYTCDVQAAGVSYGTFDVATDPIPPEIDFMGATVEFGDPTAFEPGWTLFNPTRFPPMGRPEENANLVVDPMGQIRWYVNMEGQDADAVFEYDVTHGQFYGGGGFFDPQPLRVWDLDGTEVLEWKDVEVDHDVKWIGDDFYILTPADDGRNGNHCLDQLEVSKDLVWQWCSDDTMAIPDEPANSMYVRTTKAGTYLYGTMQVFGIVYKIDRASKDVVWVFKDDGHFEGDAPYAKWMHDLHVIDCPGFTECLVLYVNGSEKDPTTLIRQVGIDETTMTASLVREWTEPGWEEPKVGGIHPFSDHWLVNEGHFVQEPLTDRPSQIVEVAPDDSVVWRLTVATTDIQVYRARRVAACDLFHHAGYCPSLEK